MKLSFDTTLDTILGGRVRIMQPAQGYRVAVDPVFLAASIPAQPGDSILDVGTGVGAAALCLAHRVAGIHLVGLELQRDIVKLAVHNVTLNGFQGVVEILNGDLTQPPPRLAPSSFNHVMANPPYYHEEDGTQSPTLSKSLSNSFGAGDLRTWVNFICLMVKPKGSVSFVYPAEKLDALLMLLHGKVGSISIFPLWSKPNAPAKRVLVRGIKSVPGGTQLLSGMLLHKETGGFTDGAERVLRHGEALNF